MKILKIISQYSTILMPALSLVGLLLPDLSNAVLPWLANILFFLMFFTLLGINQTALLQKVKALAVWRFAILQNVAMCLLLSVIAYALGIRGELLLAISAVGATAPLFGSGAIVNAMGFDALLAMAQTIIATLIMPMTLFLVLFLLAGEGAYIDVAEYLNRLLIYIVCPIVLSIICKKLIAKPVLDKVYPKVAQFNILLLLMFPLGLMGGFRQVFDESPLQALHLFLLAIILVGVIFVVSFLMYRKQGITNGIINATVSSGRNLLLTLTIAMPFLGNMFLPLVGALQLPIFIVPFIAKQLISRYDV